MIAYNEFLYERNSRPDDDDNEFYILIDTGAHQVGDVNDSVFIFL